MPYTPTVWTDESLASTPAKYSITGDIEGEISASAEIALVTSVTPGTPLNATNLNKIETGIQTAQALAEAAIPKSLVTTVGDIIYATASAVLARLGKPSVDSVLQNNSAGTPSWLALSSLVTSLIYRRKGGSATDWDSAGSNSYTPSGVKIQTGVVAVAHTGTETDHTVTLPASYANKPTVYLTLGAITGSVVYGVGAQAITTSQFGFRLKSSVSNSQTVTVYWMAIGE